MQQLYFPLRVTRVCHIRVYETGLTVECFCKEVVEAEKKGREIRDYLCIFVKTCYTTYPLISKKQIKMHNNIFESLSTVTNEKYC